MFCSVHPWERRTEAKITQRILKATRCRSGWLYSLWMISVCDPPARPSPSVNTSRKHHISAGLTRTSSQRQTTCPIAPLSSASSWFCPLKRSERNACTSTNNIQRAAENDEEPRWQKEPTNVCWSKQKALEMIHSEEKYYHLNGLSCCLLIRCPWEIGVAFKSNNRSFHHVSMALLFRPSFPDCSRQLVHLFLSSSFRII